MIETLVLADDLTGAADCAVSCATAGADTVVVFGANADFGQATVVSVDLNTRAMTAQDAGAAARSAVRQLYSHDTRILYHKIDSTLRGNWTTELSHIRQVASHGLGHAPLVILAPAFPAMGRATVGGHIRVNGRPLESTELWRPTASVRSADLRSILADVGFPVGTVSLDQIALGADALTVQFAELAKAGCGAVICDAETDDHLLVIAFASLSLPEKPLWVGSAGLMRALVRAREGEFIPRTIPSRAAAKPILVVVGSASTVSLTQSDVLAEEEGVISLSILPSALREGSLREQAEPYAKALDAALSSGADVLVTIRGEPVNFQEGPQIAANLAKLIGPRLCRAGGLIVTGGETARAILDEAGISALKVYGELEPGAPFGVAIGDIAVPVVTKAGAFGDRMTLKRCRAVLRGDRDVGSNSVISS